MKKQETTPKWHHNEAEIDTNSHQQIMPNQVAKKVMQIMNNYIFWCVKICKIIVNKCIFKGVAVCVSERKKYQTTSNIIAKIIPKSITTQCENNAQTSDAKMMENGANIDPQRELTSGKHDKSTFKNQC